MLCTCLVRSVLVGCERNGGWQFNPDQDFLLKPGFFLIAMAGPVGRQEIEQLLIDTAA